MTETRIVFEKNGRWYYEENGALMGGYASEKIAKKLYDESLLSQQVGMTEVREGVFQDFKDGGKKWYYMEDGALVGGYHSEAAAKEAYGKTLLSQKTGKPDFFVSQRGIYDSGVAALAMATRNDYDMVCSVFPKGRFSDDPPYQDVPGDGKLHVLTQEITFILFANGIANHVVHPIESNIGTEIKWKYNHRAELVAWGFDDILDYLEGGGAAILGLPSRSGNKALHWVYVEGGGNVYDPNEDDPYESLNGVELIETICLGGQFHGFNSAEKTKVPGSGGSSEPVVQETGETG